MTAAMMTSKKNSRILPRWYTVFLQENVSAVLVCLERTLLILFFQRDHKDEAGQRSWRASGRWGWRLHGGACGEHQWVHSTFRIPQDSTPLMFNSFLIVLPIHRGWPPISQQSMGLQQVEVPQRRVCSECLCFSCSPGKKARILDAEGLALGCEIATSKKKARDLVDGSFHRSGPLVH